MAVITDPALNEQRRRRLNRSREFYYLVSEVGEVPLRLRRCPPFCPSHRDLTITSIPYTRLLALLMFDQCVREFPQVPLNSFLDLTRTTLDAETAADRADSFAYGYGNLPYITGETILFDELFVAFGDLQIPVRDVQQIEMLHWNSMSQRERDRFDAAARAIVTIDETQ